MATLVDEFGALLVGEDPGQIEKHWQWIYHHQHSLRGGAIQMSAISGIEIALWDIKGKALSMPIYELLGGKIRDKLWCYGRWVPKTASRKRSRSLRRGSQRSTVIRSTTMVSSLIESRSCEPSKSLGARESMWAMESNC